MILLDTNYLINVLLEDSEETAQIKGWYRDEQLCTSAVCWYEFACGPVNEEAILIVTDLLQGRIFSLDSEQAQEAGRLYNKTGRLRHLRVDAMIAAASITSNTELATANVNDFRTFEPFGLALYQS
ncbi:MAG: PIN domain-containing protein [Spirochaetales bacterium]|nr:PIN domain-containing protein [Spirochaetales bacterium]